MAPPPALSVLVASMLANLSPNVICALFGVSAAAFLHLDSRCRKHLEERERQAGETSEEDGQRCRLRVVGCLNRRKRGDEPRDEWTASAAPAPADSEACAIEPEVRHLGVAIERLRFVRGVIACRVCAR